MKNFRHSFALLLASCISLSQYLKCDGQKTYNKPPEYRPVQYLKNSNWANISAIAISHDNSTIAFGDYNNITHVWKLYGSEYKEIQTFDGHFYAQRSGIDSILISQDNQLILTSSKGDDTVNIWIYNGYQYEYFQGLRQYSRITAIAMSPDKQFIYVGCSDNNMCYVWEFRYHSKCYKQITAFGKKDLNIDFIDIHANNCVSTFDYNSQKHWHENIVVWTCYEAFPRHASKFNIKETFEVTFPMGNLHDSFIHSGKFYRDPMKYRSWGCERSQADGEEVCMVKMSKNKSLLVHGHNLVYVYYFDGAKYNSCSQLEYAYYFGYHTGQNPPTGAVEISDDGTTIACTAFHDQSTAYVGVWKRTNI